MEAKDRVEEEDALLYRVQSSGSVESHEKQVDYELDGCADDDPAYESLTGARRPKCLRFRVVLHKRAGSASSLFTCFHTPRRRRSVYCRVLQLVLLAPYIIFSAIVICGLFYPSYANPPLRYLELRNRVQKFGQRANDHNEKIYVAASLYDHEGEVVSGQWGQSVLHLINILGPENVFLSIYENDPDPGALAALDSFRTKITCQSAIVTERLDLAELPHVSTPNGSQRLKRMQFLAHVRNRALGPLEDENSPAYNTRFDKLLYLNDVVFDPIDAANLLLNTNIDERTGRASYRATCAVDFINPFKFYDTFATRDLEGYDMGVPFYPWFTNAGKGESRKDVWHQKDAVRVKSCWGGMVAFDAKYFQTRLYSDSSAKELISNGNNILEPQTFRYDPHHDLRNSDSLAIPSPTSSPLRFRAETDTYWDASECCLIHADLSAMGDPLPPTDTGIYMNPYIRVAYSANVLPWLTFTKRFERLYPIIHSIANLIAGRPSYNPRQFQEPGDEVEDLVWTWSTESQALLRAGSSNDELKGDFQRIQRTALPGGFCGMRKLFYINEHPSGGESKWMEDKLPIVGRR